MTRARTIVLIAGLALAPFAPGALAAPDGPLPITGITLYRSGVGYFERRAAVEGDRNIQLRFKTDQVNDILKSMVLLDLDGGRVESVRYGSKDPLARRLASFGIDLSDEPAAGELLRRLRGSSVRILTTEGEASGTILNVETRPTVVGGVGDVPPARYELPWINLLTPTGVRSYNLTAVSGFEILDPALADELTKALAAIAEHRADRVKTVDLALRGGGTRRVVVAYVHEMPVWKTSYRLVLPDAGDPKARPTMQGWAIVENTTDEDWQDVRLSLVAGRPVSFQMDLYEPLYVERPEIPVPMIAGVAPRLYEGDVMFGLADKAAPAASAAPAEPGTRMRAAGRMDRDAAPQRRGVAVEESKALGAALSAEDLIQHAAQAQARGGEIGEVFQYTLQDPVTVERQRSAMLPILSSPIEGRRVSIYARADGSEHPMRGVELKNTTGLQLMPGPVSVYDGAAYAGDAQVSHVTIGDKRLLAYAVDLDVVASVKDDSIRAVQKIRIVSGLIEQTSKLQARVTYNFANKDQKRPRTVLVEHPKMPGWDLAEPSKPADETGALYRFELAIDAGKSSSMAVALERIERQSMAVTGYSVDALLAYSRQGKVSQKVVDAVREAGRLQAALNDAERRVRELDEERQAIEQDQSRIRQNMATIGRETELYRRYTTKLGEQETRLEQLLLEREKATQAVQAARLALEAYLRGLNVE